jgi:serine/threonine protein kinase
MDQVKAQLLADKIVGHNVGGWEIDAYKNHGKSAAVFRAHNSAGKIAAVKIFDDELIERYGDKVQLARIERELTLVGKTHANMVSILGGGFDELSKNHYIVMEYLDGNNLKQCLQQIPADNITSLIAQLASCAEFLESLGLCHRDIKPENIVILDGWSRLILLDFGVLRPIGKPGLTDDDGIQSFVGTLQYSSPEFLLRTEQDTIEGWRALSFYQIGAVLHDMIMRKEIFEEYAQPYAKLVNAVQEIRPEIQNSAVEPRLVDLARSCLLKDPLHRLKLLEWSSFYPSAAADKGVSAKQRVTNRAILAKAETAEKTENQPIDDRELISNTIDFLKNAVHLVRQDNDSFPPLAIATRLGKQPRFKIRINCSEEHAISRDLTIVVEVEVLDTLAKAIILTLEAFMGDPPEDKTPERLVFFRGLYDSAAMHLAFEDSLYEVIELAQRQSKAFAGWLPVKLIGEG